MQFGKAGTPEEIDFTLPKDHADTKNVLSESKPIKGFEVCVGCAKWNKTDLKNFYPKGTKDELTYYSTQFNSIELNATFYKSPSKEKVETWKTKAAKGFKFFPKIPNIVSHFKRLVGVEAVVEEFCDAVVLFEEHLGMCFLQMHDNFKPKDIDKLDAFLKKFPISVPLAIELRNEKWYSDKKVQDELHTLLVKYKKTFIIVDTASRRNIMHMRLTSDKAFIRYVGANHESDYTQLDDWVKRIKVWSKEGLNELYFSYIRMLDWNHHCFRLILLKR